MEFKLWSESNKQIIDELKPKLGLRSWNALDKTEKLAIWTHLEDFLFIPILKFDNNREHYHTRNAEKYYYPFVGRDLIEKRERVEKTAFDMFGLYRVKNYTKNLSVEKTRFNAHQDFLSIFLDEDENVVFELLSMYCKNILTDKNYSGSKHIEKFDLFSERINSVFSDFGVNVFLSQSGFIPKQDDRIVNEIFVPVLQVLKDEKWREVNAIFSDAYKCFLINTSSSYSTSVTHSVSAVQAFLQILVYGKTGTGDIATLILEGQRKKVIPGDFFTKEIFKNIVSVLMKERQETGDSHPKKEYATEENAKIVINISMIFIQHCLSI